MKVRRMISLSFDSIILFLFVYLIVFPKNVSEDTKSALSFCAQTLIPSLFIYTVLSKAVFSMPIASMAVKIIGLPAFSLIMGTLCGAPLGAKNALFLYENKKIDKKYAEYLCSFSNNASISFVVGYVGYVLFGDISVGIRLLVYQLLASVFTAVIMKRLMFGRTRMLAQLDAEHKKIALSEIIVDSAHTIIAISACAVFFMVISESVSRMLSLGKIQNAILLSMLEFSSGVSASATMGNASVALCAFAIGLTGFSVAIQVKSVVAKKLSMRCYFVGKLISCAVMTSLAFIFG